MRQTSPAPSTDSAAPEITNVRPVSGRSAAQAIELAYGLLWHVPIDRRTEAGLLISLARGTLLDHLDPAGRARGIEHARRVRANVRTPENSPERATDRS